MREGVSWQGAKADLFDEAMRVVPAVAGHRARGDKVSVNATLLAYHNYGLELEVPTEHRWAVLVSAYMVWTQNLFEIQADLTNTTTPEVLAQAVGAAAEWVATP